MPDEPTTNDKVEEEVVLADPSQTPEPEVKEEPEAQAEPEPVEEPEAPAEEPVAVEEQEQAPAPPSRREQLRIQDLLKKYGPPPERPTSQAPSQERLDYSQALDADPEVIKQLEADREREAQAQYNRGQSESLQALQYTQFYNNIRFDLPLVQDMLSKLDPVDAKELDDEYVAVTGADTKNGTVRNPDIGYADWIRARIDQATRLASSMNAETVRNVAKQAAATGLRPDGSSAKRMNLNQAPEKMTLDELYAASGLPDTRKK